jgi:hypothetical protein
MKKTATWKNKWQALLDMKAAQSAGQGTISVDTQTEEHTVSGATTGRDQTVMSIGQLLDAWLTVKEKQHPLSKAYLEKPWPPIYTDTASQCMNYWHTDPSLVKGEPAWASSTETKKEPLLPLKQGTLTPPTAPKRNIST